MTKIVLSVVLVSAFFLNFILPAGAFADYYKYTDGRGVATITNKLDSVPAKYRSTMKVIREEPKKKQQAPAPESEAAATAPEQTAVAAPEQVGVAAPQSQAAGKFAELSARFPWFKPLVYLAAIVALFVITVKLTSLLPSPLLSKLILISFFLGVFVFLYKSYVSYVVESSARIKNNAITIMKKSSNRELPVPEGDGPPAQH